jgi:hypothetical protein
MKKLREYWVLICLTAMICAAAAAIARNPKPVHGQGLQALSYQGSGPHATCATPVVGTTWFCVATDGVYVSTNGGAYAQIGLPVASIGVSSITVCSATGGACGPPQTGAVNLNIPTKGSAAAPAVTLQ